MRWFKYVVCAILAVMATHGASAQIVVTDKDEIMSADSVKAEYDKRPYFGLYKDNYFIFGPSVGPKITRSNTNVKFQISIAQRLTNCVLPWETFLTLFYTQKCFWNVLEKSFPMTDLNFNPGIGLVKPLFSKDRYIGKVSLIIEHESNGRDSIFSRSWNRVSLAASIFVDPNILVFGKVWAPWVDGENNRDLLDYYGIWQSGVTYLTSNRRFQGTILLTKRRGWDFNYNTVVELSIRLSKHENQHLFIQYYNGYGEGMLDYNKFRSQLRVGFVIKPRFFSDY
ncbi:MAG: phospholipase A [Muribaculum sp.]|nr:phospholipase A [Muribaculaceae bacterium]MCM1081141.1 phospholipase A [Muribaculum sp.]